MTKRNACRSGSNATRSSHDDQPYTFLFERKCSYFIDKRIKNVGTSKLGLNYAQRLRDADPVVRPARAMQRYTEIRGRAMLSYIIRRLLLAVPTLIGMTAVVFFIMGLSPGRDGGDARQGRQLKPQEREAIKKYLEERYGLDKPLIVQYGRWLKKISPVQIGPGPMGWPWFKKPDLGESFIRSRKVSDLIADALPVTLLLNLLSLPIIYYAVGADRREGRAAPRASCWTWAAARCCWPSGRSR